MNLAYPWVLALLPLIAFLSLRRHKFRTGVKVASLLLWEHADSGRARYLWLPRILRLLGLSLIVICLARPQAGSTQSMQVSNGIAIQLLVDVSSSMDMTMNLPNGESRSRIEVAKELVEKFIMGDGDDLKGRDGDLIGLITFARYPDTRSPLTFGLPALLQLVRNLKIQDRPNEDGTAYGDALALAAARLEHLDSIGEEQGWSVDGEISSRVIVLLTDGENNSGKHLPLEAAGLAKKWGCKVYCISLGDTDYDKSGLQGELSPSEKVLEHISKETGGVFRKAFDYESLRSVYAEIDELEQSEISTRSYNRVSELYWIPLLAALVALLISFILEATWLRTAP